MSRGGVSGGDCQGEEYQGEGLNDWKIELALLNFLQVYIIATQCKRLTESLSLATM